MLILNDKSDFIYSDFLLVIMFHNLACVIIRCMLELMFPDVRRDVECISTLYTVHIPHLVKQLYRLI